jgi:hypothetical protein
MALLLAVSTACTSPRTEVIVIVDAQVGVRTETRRLRVLYWGGATRDSLAEIPPPDESMPTSFPVQIPLIPAGNDGTRAFRVEVLALDASGAVVASVRAVSGFVQGHTLALRLTLEDGCIGRTCTNLDQTCAAGACTSAIVDASTLPDYSPPAQTDAGTAACGNGVVETGEDCDEVSRFCVGCTNTCGDGTVDPNEQCFMAPGVTLDTASPGFVGLGRLNADSHLDLVLYFPPRIVVRFGDGTGAFASPGVSTSLAGTPPPFVFGPVDVDSAADGRDEFVMYDSVCSPPPCGNLAIASVDATGVVTISQRHPFTFMPGGPPALGDPNNDGQIEIFVPDAGTTATTIHPFGESGGALTEFATATTTLSGVAVGGQMGYSELGELLVVGIGTPLALHPTIYAVQSDFRLMDTGYAWPTERTWLPQFFAIGQVDAGAENDLVVIGVVGSIPTTTVISGLSPTRAPTTGADRPWPNHSAGIVGLAVHSFDGDTHDDAVLVPGGQEFIYGHGDGAGGFTELPPSIDFGCSGGVTGAAPGDVNEDGVEDIVIGVQGCGVHLLLSNP